MMWIKTSRLWNVSFERNLLSARPLLQKEFGGIGESLFTFLASLTYAHHHLMKLITWYLWVLKEHNNFRYLWKFEPNIVNGFGEMLF